MTWFSCKGCKAKDEEIARLWSLVAAERETVVLPVPPEPTPPDPDPLPKVIDAELEKRYERNSREWRAEARAARKLLKDGYDQEAIAVLVRNGQSTDRW